MPAALAALGAAERDADDDSSLQWAQGRTYFQGLLLYTSTLEPFGNVTHLEDGFFREPTGYENGYWNARRNAADSGGEVTRALRRGDALFSFSDNSVVKTSLDGKTRHGAADMAAGVDFEDLEDDDRYGYYVTW